MNRKILHDLLERYTTGQCSAEERLLVEHWYELIGESRDFSLSGPEWESLENRIWAKLEPGRSDASETKVTPLWKRLSIAVAAAALLVMGIYWYQSPALLNKTQASLVAAGEKGLWKTYANATDRTKDVKLPDGSVITLAAHAQLAVSKDYNVKNRDVRLLGKATFDIARNPAVPFMLFCGDMVTRVLGTRFQVVADNVNEPMEVTVKSGKVTVYRSHTGGPNAASASNGVILTPNQKATYYPDNKQFVAGLTEHPEVVGKPAKKEVEFVFEETPLSEIAAQLQDAYGIEIELEQDAIAHCPFTGNLSKQDLYTKLELLCGSVNGTFEVRGTKILVMGKGCQ